MVSGIRRIDLKGVTMSVKKSLVDQDEITLVHQDDLLSSKSSTLNDAVKFVAEIKNRMGNDKYKSFLGILHGYLRRGKSINDLYQEVITLLDDDQYLIDKFQLFFPNNASMWETKRATSREQPK